MRMILKFGGSSLADLQCIRHAAALAAKQAEGGAQVVVVVSAQADTTDLMIRQAKELSPCPDGREMDAFLSAGEQMSAALMAMALHCLGVPAVSFTGKQAGIHTDGCFGQARITEVTPSKIQEALEAGKIAVVAGFQGVDCAGNTTTLGRGGSDTTAVALAAALEADACEIFTDVEGVFTTDPNICEKARKIDAICYDEMLELASLGAKVLDIRAVGLAKRFKVPVHVRSTFTHTIGTWVVEEEKIMESMLVSGVTYSKKEACITVRKVPDQPGIAAKIFMPISDAGILVDMIIQNAHEGGLTDMTFTVPKADYARTMEILGKVARDIHAESVIGDQDIAKVSIVGVGMRNHSGIASTMFQIMSREGINMMMVSTSEIKVSVVIAAKYTELAVRALHDAFALDKDNPPREEAA